MAALEQRAETLDAAIRGELETLPNRLNPDVPEGADEAANLVLRQEGELRSFDFALKEHFELGEALRQDGLRGRRQAVRRALHRAARPLARLHRALGQFMLDLHTGEHGYTETQRAAAGQRRRCDGTGQAAEVRARTCSATNATGAG